MLYPHKTKNVVFTISTIIVTTLSPLFLKFSYVAILFFLLLAVQASGRINNIIGK